MADKKSCMIGTGAMCDPYMHCEEELELTRKCLKLIDRYGFGLAIQTKSNRILRDLDLLKSINRKTKCVVYCLLSTTQKRMWRESWITAFRRKCMVSSALESE